jgi:hypothetical protein
MPLRPRFERFVWIAIAGSLFLLVLFLGDSIRQFTSPELRLTLCITGAVLSVFSMLAYIVSPAAPFGISDSVWIKALGSAALVGFVLFILFVQDVECELHSSGREISTQCKSIYD